MMQAIQVINESLDGITSGFHTLADAVIAFEDELERHERGESNNLKAATAQLRAAAGHLIPPVNAFMRASHDASDELAAMAKKAKRGKYQYGGRR